MGTKKPVIYYFAYDHQKPMGGQKSVYRHVDILNANGYHAAILHIQSGYTLKWFEHDTCIVYSEQFKREFSPDDDFIVLPEDLGLKILAFRGNKVIINQGVYFGFYVFGFSCPPCYPYLHHETIAALVKSQHSRDYLQTAYPQLPIHIVYNSIDPEVFGYIRLSGKKKIIACPSNKNTMDLTQVYNILMSRAQQGLNVLREYEWVFFENEPHHRVVSILKDAVLFLFLSVIEGFGRMPLEAMASGCLVVAYDIAPLNEFLCSSNALLCTRGDVLGVVAAIEQCTAAMQESSDVFTSTIQQGYREAQKHNKEKETASVINAWHRIMENHNKRE